MDLKTIALDSRSAVAQLKEFTWGYNDGLRGESADPAASKEYWAGTVWTVDFLATGWAGVRLLDNPDIVRIQNGRSLVSG